jgi:hypothetical protein
MWTRGLQQKDGFLESDSEVIYSKGPRRNYKAPVCTAITQWQGEGNVKKAQKALP